MSSSKADAAFEDIVSVMRRHGMTEMSFCADEIGADDEYLQDFTMHGVQLEAEYPPDCYWVNVRIEPETIPDPVGHLDDKPRASVERSPVSLLNERMQQLGQDFPNIEYVQTPDGWMAEGHIAVPILPGVDGLNATKFVVDRSDACGTKKEAKRNLARKFLHKLK